MTKKKTTTAKAKAAEVEKKEPKKTEIQAETKKVETATDDPSTKEASKQSETTVESTKNISEGKDTSKVKEGLKSPEIKSNGFDYLQAEEKMDLGHPVTLPEWGGFWFKPHEDPSKTYVLTKEGEVLDTPHEEYKERKDWKIAEPTKEQEQILEKFWKKRQQNIDSEASKQKEDYDSLNAVAHARSVNGAFVKLKKKISISDLSERKNLPVETERQSLFLMDNGFVFDLEKGELTTRQEQEILKSIK